jgi:DNA-directed RNA polymerase beta subunit
LDKAIEEGFDFAIPFFATMQALDIDMGEIREQVVYLCDVPLMLDKGYFLIDGVERVVPPKIEQLPDGTWRTHEIGEIFRERLMTGLDDVVLELKERLAETEWEGLIPQNLLDISPLVSSIQAIFNESGIEDHAYHEAAYDCMFDFHEEDTEPCPYDDEEAFELKVKARNIISDHPYMCRI